mmetsp:Transcript_72041/g.192515  ORF Transcript_72041/g.192515 Transcript_72041/m.192515 type:complete len:206 (-) Transcript_72041:302-919(-)
MKISAADAVACLHLGRGREEQLSHRALLRRHEEAVDDGGEEPRDGLVEDGVALQVSADAARVERVGVDPLAGQTPVQRHGEEHVGELGAGVCRPLRVTILARRVDVVEGLDAPGGHVVRGGGGVDDAAGLGLLERGEQQHGEEEVAQVVRAKLHLDALLREGERANHHASVVHEDVQWAAGSLEPVGEGADRLEVGEVQLGVLHA